MEEQFETMRYSRFRLLTELTKAIELIEELYDLADGSAGQIFSERRDKDISNLMEKKFTSITETAMTEAVLCKSQGDATPMIKAFIDKNKESI